MENKNLTEQTDIPIEKRLLSLRIIFFALLAGLLAFLCLAFILQSKGLVKDDSSESLTKTLELVWIILFVLETGFLLFFRIVLKNTTKRENQTSKNMGRIVSITILGTAVGEGLGLFAGLIYLLSGQATIPMVFVGISLLVMLAYFPTRRKFEEPTDTFTIPE